MFIRGSSFCFGSTVSFLLLQITEKKKDKKKTFLSWIALQLWKPLITSVGLQLHQRYYISLSNIFTGLFNSCIISSEWLLFSSTSLNIHLSKFTEIQRMVFPFTEGAAYQLFFFFSFYEHSFFPFTKEKIRKIRYPSMSLGNQRRSVSTPPAHRAPLIDGSDSGRGHGDRALCGIPQGGSFEAAAVPGASHSPLHNGRMAEGGESARASTRRNKSSICPRLQQMLLWGQLLDHCSLKKHLHHRCWQPL